MGFIPTMPRPYWDRLTLDFMRMLDSKVLHDSREELGIKLKPLSIRSLFSYKKRKHATNGELDSLIRGFLDEDSTHLNTKGYAVLTRDISIPIMDYWGELMKEKSMPK